MIPRPPSLTHTELLTSSAFVVVGSEGLFLTKFWFHFPWLSVHKPLNLFFSSAPSFPFHFPLLLSFLDFFFLLPLSSFVPLLPTLHQLSFYWVFTERGAKRKRERCRGVRLGAHRRCAGWGRAMVWEAESFSLLSSSYPNWSKHVDSMIRPFNLVLQFRPLWEMTFMDVFPEKCPYAYLPNILYKISGDTTGYFFLHIWFSFSILPLYEEV